MDEAYPPSLQREMDSRNGGENRARSFKQRALRGDAAADIYVNSLMSLITTSFEASMPRRASSRGESSMLVLVDGGKCRLAQRLNA